MWLSNGTNRWQLLGAVLLTAAGTLPGPGGVGACEVFFEPLPAPRSALVAVAGSPRLLGVAQVLLVKLRDAAGPEHAGRTVAFVQSVRARDAKRGRLPRNSTSETFALSYLNLR